MADASKYKIFIVCWTIVLGSPLIYLIVHNFILPGNCHPHPFSISYNCCSEFSVEPTQHKQLIARSYDLTFEHGLKAPDGYMQEVILTNGLFPGPEIRLKQGEILFVTIRNKLRHGFALHFHGILQSGSISADGVPGITQYKIPSNGTVTYRINTGEQSGTFIYHAHTGLHLNWAFGSLIIEEASEKFEGKIDYFDEMIFILSQCWHVPISELEKGVLGSPYQDLPDTDSLLINGISYGEWDQVNFDERSEGYKVYTVLPNMTYRFRIIGFGMDSMLSYQIDKHELKIIEIDGILVNPFLTKQLFLNSAQRYSVLVTMNQSIGNYWIRTEMIPGPGPSNGLAILHYKGAPDPWELRKTVMPHKSEEKKLKMEFEPELLPDAEIAQPIVYPVPSTYDREIVIKSHERDIGNGKRRFDINGHLYKDHDIPLLYAVRAGLNTTGEPQLFKLKVGTKIQIVFQNTFTDEGKCEQHPWHAHGHYFHVVKKGPDEYQPFDSQFSLQEKFSFRDVVTVFPNRTDNRNDSNLACGWTAVRFVVNNPGLWLVHCHLTAHMLIGKKFILYEHSNEDPKLLNAG